MSAVRYDIESRHEISHFNEYCFATKPVPESASEVHHLYLMDGKMMRKCSDSSSFVDVNAVPLRIALQSFVDWMFQHFQEDPKQQLLIGYNNFAFDDHILLHHLRDKLEDFQFSTIRQYIFSSDIKSILKLQRKLVIEAQDCGIDTTRAHDSAWDCKMVSSLTEARGVAISQIIANSRSFESVYSTKCNPLLRSNMITKVVAMKLPRQLTHDEWFRMSDEELTSFLQNCGVTMTSILTCIRKRNEFMK